jgi:SAM-dependent methyltransferase
VRAPPNTGLRAARLLGSSGHLTPDLQSFVLEWLPATPARVLEVGCGDGALTRRLGQAGYDAIGLDPDAPPGNGFVRGSLEDFETPQRFDAAVAVRSLHHVHDLDAALDRLTPALVPGARLVLFEFAVESIDVDARRWLASNGLEWEVDWDFEGVIRLADLRDALERRFSLLYEEPTPYLARELNREALHEREKEAITRGELKPPGMRLVYQFASDVA